MFLHAAGIAAALSLSVIGGEARAEVPVQRTRFQVPASNGHGAVLLDLKTARLTHFREHLFATEEPVIDQNGADVWDGNGFASVHTRDLLWDAYFGLRGPDGQRWLTDVPVDFDASGYASWAPGKKGGTGVVVMVQHAGDLTTTQYFFAPQSLPHASFVMAMSVKNTGASAAPKVQAFVQQNFHLGYGRPGVRNDIEANGETLIFDGSGGKADIVEKAFAGLIASRALAPVARRGAGTGGQIFDTVKAGEDLPDNTPPGAAQDDSVSAYQFDLGDIAPGGEKWCGVAFVHHPDPFGDAEALSWLDTYVGAKGAKELVEAEIAGWAAFQNNVVKPPAGLSADEDTLVRQSAVMLHMAQNREERTFLREWKDKDGDPRRTRFAVEGGGALPGWVYHKGKGAVLASLPPGEWTYAWIRDGAYATVAMAALGMKDEAKAALLYYLNAEAGRFQQWDELKPYGMPPYQISLVRYHGFGVEETDFNAFGPNLEFDGFGLFLWALREYEVLTGDKSVSEQYFSKIATEIADPLRQLIEKDATIGQGLIKRDSSIWESHWKGRERYWAYTSITAARGLCDASKIAQDNGSGDFATGFQNAGRELRQAIADKLLDKNLAIASTAEELASGRGHYDASVLDALALGLFDPKGKIASATRKAMDDQLLAAAGAGWARNDDRTDHKGQEDLSPWGSEYDSAEWVITDMRGAIAARLAGDEARADRLTKWVLDQSLMNYLMVAETYDEQTGAYKFNSPMAGFGSGAYVLALAQRAGMLVDPACGAYFDETNLSGAGGGGGSGSGSAGTSTGGHEEPPPKEGCACRSAGTSTTNVLMWMIPAALALGLARRRRR